MASPQKAAIAKCRFGVLLHIDTSAVPQGSSIQSRSGILEYPGSGDIIAVAGYQSASVLMIVQTSVCVDRPVRFTKGSTMFLTPSNKSGDRFSGVYISPPPRLSSTSCELQVPGVVTFVENHLGIRFILNIDSDGSFTGSMTRPAHGWIIGGGAPGDDENDFIGTIKGNLNSEQNVISGTWVRNIGPVDTIKCGDFQMHFSQGTAFGHLKLNDDVKIPWYWCHGNEASMSGGTVDISTASLIRFSSGIKGNAMDVSIDGTTVTLEDDPHSGARGMVLGDVGFSAASGGVYYWEIRVNQAAYDYGTIFVGVSEGVSSQRIEDSPASVIKALGRWDALDSSLGYVNFRAVLEMQGGAGNEQIYGEFFGTGDIIGVCLDMDRRELSFFIDGMKFGQHIVKDLGRAFQFKAKQVLYPCVGLRKSRGDSVTIGKWTHVRNPSPLMSLRSLGASLLQLEHFYGSGVGIASHIADACWDHYTQWSQRAEGLRGEISLVSIAVWRKVRET